MKGIEAVDSEELRVQLRTKALDSLYFLSKAVLGFKDFTPELHLPVCNFVQQDEPRKKMILLPRGHFKSTIVSVSHPIFKYLHDHNERFLLANEVATNSEHFLRLVKAQFERNELFQWLFPEAIPDWKRAKKWSDVEILLPRDNDFMESTIETIGVGGAVTSRHYTHIKDDDLVGIAASESLTVMEKTILWHKYTESLLESSALGHVDVVGTRYGFADLYYHIEETDPEYVLLHKEAYENGEPIFPKRFSKETLQKILTKVGPYIFSCQYLNNPSNPDLADFRSEWLRYYRQNGSAQLILGNKETEKVHAEGLYKVITVDPAVSEKRTASRSAIVVSGMSEKGSIVVLEAWARRVAPQELVNKIFEFNEKYKPAKIGIETFAMQKVLVFWLREEEKRRQEWLPLCELKLDTIRSKEARIRSLQPYFAANRVFIKEDMIDFITEYNQFPVGKTADILDAFAYGPQLWLQPKTDEMIEQELRADRRALRSMNIHTGY